MCGLTAGSQLGDFGCCCNPLLGRLGSCQGRTRRIQGGKIGSDAVGMERLVKTQFGEFRCIAGAIREGQSSRGSGRAVAAGARLLSLMAACFSPSPSALQASSRAPGPAPVRQTRLS